MGTKIAKSLPKRANSDRKKAARAASNVRGQARKAERVRKQKEAEQRNRLLRSEGALTPHEMQRAKRAQKRANDPEVQRRKALFETDEQKYWAERRARGVPDTPPKKKGLVA